MRRRSRWERRRKYYSRRRRTSSSGNGLIILIVQGIFWTGKLILKCVLWPFRKKPTKFRKKTKNSQELFRASIEGKKDKELNQEQKEVEKLVLDGKSIFLTGSAGTGKSFLLRHLIKLLQKKHGVDKVGITSTTGTGALIIGGKTFHSYLGIGIVGHLDKETLVKKISADKKVWKNWENARVLIIDEISMLEGKVFDKLESIAQTIRKSKEPFGGIQIILVGDFCQLPPPGQISQFCFETPTWRKCINQTINLVQVYRQKDDWFINYLNDIRFARLEKEQWEVMLKKLCREPNWPDDGIKPTILLSTKKEISAANRREIKKLRGKTYTFLAKDQENVPGELKELTKDCLAHDELELKKGCQVMLIKNWREKNLVNGSQGVIVGFTNDPYPIVKFADGNEIVVRERAWEKVESYDEKGNPIISAKREQIPLIPSWAITIHKSQGQSIERLKVDLSKCFMSGQVYTALSRATNPSYLQIIDFPYSRLFCRTKVKEFYQSLSTGALPVFSERVKEKKRYPREKVREKWKEFLSIYEQTLKWPYKEIEEWFFQVKEEYKKGYFQDFCEIIERSISNSQNLVTYRQLLEYLKNTYNFD